MRRILYLLPRFIRDRVTLARIRYCFRGKGCQIDSLQVSLNAVIADHVRIPKDNIIYANVSIGRYTYMQTGCEINNSTIGNFCSLGSNILIGAWQHPLNLISTSPRLYREVGGGKFDDTPKHTKIGHDVWIGSYAIILDGVIIGDGAVVGAGAIVTKDVPPYAIVVGNPAHIVRYRFTEERIKELQESDWYNMKDIKLKEIVKGTKVL